MSNSSGAAAQIENLKREHPGIDLATDDASCNARSRDWWMRSLIASRIGESRRPAAVIRPGSTAQVAAVLRWADAAGIGVVPFGLGSGVCGAVVPERDQVVLDLGRMSSLLELNEHSLTVTVQPGMRGSDFEQALGERGFTMGHFPQSIALSTVGGWCATRAAGQLSTRYGNIEDMLLGCEVVLAGGRAIRLPATPRSSTGPDLREVFLGSEGTLGVFTELVFRIHPRAEAERAEAFVVSSVAAGMESLRRTMRAGWRPAVTRLYDATETGRNFRTAAEGSPMLLIVSEGPRSLVDAELDAVRQLVAEQGGRSVGEDPVRSWLEHRNHVPSFTSLLDQGLVVDTIEVAAAWDKLDRLYGDVVAHGSRIDGMIAMSGHVSHCYTQGANIYFTFVAAHGGDLQKALAIYDSAWDVTMRCTHQAGGTIAHHHGIGRVRKEWLKAELGDAYDVLVRIKKALDPKGIMNPGALIG